MTYRGQVEGVDIKGFAEGEGQELSFFFFSFLLAASLATYRRKFLG